MDVAKKKPWIGLLMIRSDRQRDGLAAEVLSAFADHLRRRGFSVVRAGVVQTNTAGLGLTRHLGFAPVESKKIRLGSGKHDVVVVERPLP